MKKWTVARKQCASKQEEEREKVLDVVEVKAEAEGQPSKSDCVGWKPASKQQQRADSR